MVIVSSGDWPFLAAKSKLIAGNFWVESEYHYLNHRVRIEY